MINQQKDAARQFANDWKDKGYEKGESQAFWNALLRDIFGVRKPEQFIKYEDQVLMDKSTGFIDGYISSTRVLIEQKSLHGLAGLETRGKLFRRCFQRFRPKFPPEIPPI